jgi:undecaprenyl diphosphate synthase
MDSKTAANLKLPADLDPSRLPRHVAIIMDGNGRWAESRGMRRLSGHRRGKDSVKAIVEASRELGIEFLSLYAFSSENWQRPETEVSGLMRLLKQYLTNELDRMMQNGVRLRVIGNVQRLPADVQRALQRVVKETLDNTGLTVTLALSYSAREEIVAAVRAIACKVRDGELAPESIDEALVTRSLGTAGIPDPDLLIRTSGEVRLSNFLLWQVAYTEIYITETLWPDFREKEFLEALRQFQARERRFGRVVDGRGDQARLRAAN